MKIFYSKIFQTNSKTNRYEIRNQRICCNQEKNEMFEHRLIFSLFSPSESVLDPPMAPWTPWIDVKIKKQILFFDVFSDLLVLR